MTNEDLIIINKDKLFKLIKEIKEARPLMVTAGNGPALLKKHDMKVQMTLLDKILINKGIDFLFDELRVCNEFTAIIEEVKKHE